MNAPETHDPREMTSDTVGKSLLSALLIELKLLPKPWPKLSQKQQDDIIDRLRLLVRDNVANAVRILSTNNKTVVTGDLAQITIKDGVKAVIDVPGSDPFLHELYDAQGKSVLIVVSDSAAHTVGMNEIEGEADQRAINLGHEYHDNDGGGMEGGEVIEGEAA